MTDEVITVDDLEVAVRRSSRRKTIALTVDRSGGLVVAVPDTLSEARIRQVVGSKRLWIYDKLGKKARTVHPTPEKEYVSGEGFYYLGRKYRLKVATSGGSRREVPDLQLKNGRFLMQRDAVRRGRECFVNWYTVRGKEWIPNTLQSLGERVGVAPRSVGVRDLRFRWGSCTPKGDLYFHWRVMLLPPYVVRYLITHELVHLREHNHGDGFYTRLEQVAPEFREIEAWLAGNGSRYVL